MSEDILIAIIGAGAVILAAIITGLFGLTKTKARHKNKKSNIQKIKGNNNTQIGVQNNTSIHIGDKESEDGTLIIDGGSASGSGSIKFVPSGKDVD